MRTRRFRAEVEDGHKGCAVIVPFDPEKEWGVRPTKVLGSSMGVFVEGTINAAPFSGWVGHRWGRFFVLTDETLLRAAGAKAGDVVDVTLTPRASATEGAPKAARKKAPPRGGSKRRPPKR